MSLRNVFCERIVLPLSDLLKGEKTARYFRFLRNTENWSREQIDAYQNERLRLLVRHSVEHVPYYRDLFQQLNLKSDDIQTKADLKKIPVVTKAIMKAEGTERFTAEGFPKKEMIYERSGGSTGEPLSYYVTKDSSSFNLAAKLHTWYQSGYRLGDRYMKIANGNRGAFIKRLQDSINNSIFVPFNGASEERLVEILKLIDQKKSLYIRSYPIPLFLLAQYRNAHPEFHHCPRCIFTTGSTLSEDYRREIEKAFGCKIIDSYSCEGNANVAECITHSCYHVSEEYGVTEVIDSDGKDIENGIGKVVSTDLWNFAFPFIRYDTQDLVEVDESHCECGNQYKVIKRIMGRECESFIASNGRFFTVHDFTGFLKLFPKVGEAIEAYQVVKKKDGSILLRFVVNSQFTEAMSQEVVQYWTEQLQKPVLLELVPEIPIMENNKRLSIIEEK